jgi:DNA-binding IclR family transcriptional regulator
MARRAAAGGSMIDMSLAPAADHALVVLRLLAGQAEPLPAAQIAARLGLPRSTVYRLLGILRDHGFVTHLAEEQRWGLGLAAYELGSAYSRQEPLQRLARPLVHRLVDTTTQNAHLAVLRGRDVFYVLEDRAPHRPLLITDVGVRLPAVTTASGRAMLARLPPRQIRALYPTAAALEPALGPAAGPATVSELRGMLVAVRARGYATEEGSITLGLSSVAQAVLDPNGHPVAAVAVTYDSATPDVEVEILVDAVRRTADRIGRRLRGGA